MDDEELKKEIKTSITCIARRFKMLDTQVIEFFKKIIK